MTDRARAGHLGRRTFLAGSAALGLAACAGSGSGGSDDGGTDRPAPETVRYGPAARQVADLYRPKGSLVGVPMVVLLHGGYWRASYTRKLMAPMAEAFVAHGWAALNVEYRAADADGGWPDTFLDVAEAVDWLAAHNTGSLFDLDNVAVLGHSAGGPLALWAAYRSKLPAGAPGAKPKVKPVLAVSIAGINNLRAGVFEQLGQHAVVELMGGEPEALEAEYRQASAAEHLPIGTPQIIEYGLSDPIVPAEQSTAYAGKADKAGDDVTLLAIAGADHFDLIDPTHPGFQKLRSAMDQALGA